MRGDLQSEINPYVAPIVPDYGAPKAASDAAKPVPSGDKIDFLSVLNNSNSDTKRERDAKKAGETLSGAETYDEFLNKMSENTRKLREPKNNLDKDDFLKLFVTQLQHQDPLNPDDSTEMASKLAHFNSLEQMLNVNKTLTTMSDMQKQNRSVELVSYIGKEVEIDGGRVRFENGAVTDGIYKVARPASSARMEVRDAAGQVVHMRELGGLNEGEHKFEWDGLKTDGTKAGNGVYSFSILAKGINNEDIPVTVRSRAKITGVDIKDGEGGMHTTLGKVKLDDVNSIGDVGFVHNAVKTPTLPATNVKLPEQPEIAMPEQAAAVPSEIVQQVAEQTKAAAQSTQPPAVQSIAPVVKEVAEENKKAAQAAHEIQPPQDPSETSHSEASAAPKSNPFMINQPAAAHAPI